MSRFADPVNSLESALERARAMAHLNAFIALAEDDRPVPPAGSPLEPANGEPGPLWGTPIAVKDSIDVAGFPCTAGTPALRDWRPQIDAPIVRTLRDAGAVVVGKTNLHELSAGITSNNRTFGPVHNPYDGRLIAGGSSGGSAAAVAAGVVPIALGADTAGSCRIPASLCGCVGFRPTVGRYPGDGIVPLSSTRDTVGTLTRTVDVAIVVDHLLSGSRCERFDLTGRRLGIPRAYFYDDLDEEIRPVIDAALDRLADAGAVLIETEISGIEEVIAPVALDLTLSEWPRDLAIYLARHRSRIHVAEIVDAMAGDVEREWLANELWGQAVPHERYISIIARSRPDALARYVDTFRRDRLDALALPTTRLPARPIGDDETVLVNGQPVGTLTAYLRNTDATAFAGLPSLSVPAGITRSGLPVGLNFDGLPGTDSTLLAIGAAFQRLDAPLPTPPDPTAKGDRPSQPSLGPSTERRTGSPGDCR